MPWMRQERGMNKLKIPRFLLYGKFMTSCHDKTFNRPMKHYVEIVNKNYHNRWWIWKQFVYPFFLFRPLFLHFITSFFLQIWIYSEPILKQANNKQDLHIMRFFFLLFLFLSSSFSNCPCYRRLVYGISSWVA